MMFAVSATYGFAEADRFDEYAVVAQHVPHERIRTWPIGNDGIGMELLVKRGTNDKQLAELVRWYVSVHAKLISIYDNRESANKREGLTAFYDNGELTRMKFNRKGEWVGMTPIPLAP
jgi:hypothetical protein